MSYLLEHIGLPANNPTALKDWYLNVLDAEVIFANQQVPPMFLIRLPGGRVMIEIYAGDRGISETRDNKVNGWRHVALRVDSIDAAKTRLEARGVEFSDEIRPAGGGGRVLFFADGEGNLLHLVERTLDSPVF